MFVGNNNNNNTSRSAAEASNNNIVALFVNFELSSKYPIINNLLHAANKKRRKEYDPLPVLLIVLLVLSLMLCAIMETKM